MKTDMKICLGVPLLFVLALCCLHASSGSPKITGVYSDMYYNEEGGDVVGVEVFLIGSSKGYYVVFQAAEGEPSVPLVVPASISGADVSFRISDGDGFNGPFKGKLSKDSLVGSFEGGETLTLRRGKSYWQ